MNAFTSVRPKSEAKESQIRLKEGEVLSAAGKPIPMKPKGNTHVEPSPSKQKTLIDLIKSDLVYSCMTAKSRRYRN